MVRGLRVLCLVLALAGGGPALAQGAKDKTTAWVRMPGTAADISINADGQAYVVSPGGTPWRWDKVEQRWRRMSGNFVRIAAAVGNRPWAVNADGVVYHYNGLWWEDKDKGVGDVAADAAGNVYIAKTNGEIRKWYPLSSEWRPFAGSAWRIALDGAGQPWVVAGDGAIRFFDGKAWTTLPGRARDIALGGVDVAAIADADGLVRTWDAAGKRWVVVPGVGDASSLGVTPEGRIWAVVKDGAIMANGALASDETQTGKDKATEPKAVAQQASGVAAPAASASVPAATTPAAPPVQAAPVMPGGTAPSIAGKGAPSTASAAAPYIDPVTVTTQDTITFVNTLQTAGTLAIGADGSVFGLDGGGNVLRWSNQQKKFNSFPGSLVRIAVDKDGHPWGLSALGRVFHHDGSRWKQIPNATASDIAVGFDGTVLTANAAGRLYKLNAEQTRFEMISGTGAVLVAAGPDGTPWAVRSDKLVQRCDVSPCKVYGQKATAIAVGPDGSVYIVSDSGRLMRLDEDGKFQVVQTPGHVPQKVAVGPMGYPWVVSSAGVVLASHYFERDEGGDRLLAASTPASGTTGTGSTEQVVSTTVSGFTFTKNMQFETVNSDVLSGGEYALLAAGNDGTFYAYNYGGGFVTYDTKQKKFVAKSTTAGTCCSYRPLDFDVASNGDIWFHTNYDANTPGTKDALYRERNKSIKEYSVGTGTGAVAGVAVAPDNSVYVQRTEPGGLNYLYKKAASSQAFTKFSTYSLVHDFDVGPGNDVWIVDKNNYVRQWTGTTFEKRPTSGQKASRIGVGADGTVYVAGTDNTLYKWNGANKSFDKVNNATTVYIAVDDDGRPWLSVNNTPTIKRAKD